eukprot:m.160025 g.160025  ORF g.160025 m.160025 type:complete len:806 (+) comp17617_c0_seq1:93-2510(+)
MGALKPALVVALCVASLCTLAETQPAPPPSCPADRARLAGVDVATDCAMRELTQRAAEAVLPAHLVSTGNKAVFEALQRGNLCNATHAPVVPTPATKTAAVASAATTIVYVDATKGNDQTGTGSLNKPFQSVGRGVTACAGKADTELVLRGGTYYLGETVVLDKRHNGLTITSYPGEQAVLSGGSLLSGLNWSPYPARKGVFQAPLPPGTKPFDGIFVNGRREIRARYPNGDPATMGRHTCPTGMVDGASWHVDSPTPKTKPSKVVVKGVSRPGPDFDSFSMQFDGLAERYNPPHSFWGGTPRPTSLDYSGHVPDNKTFAWANATTGVLHTYHGGLWGGWMFKITGHNSDKKTITLDPWGGQQEARGNNNGRDWYVENLLEELDAQREWFADTKGSSPMLYYFPANGTAPPSSVVAATLTTLFSINASQAAPVTGVTFSNLSFTHTATTFLGSYEVPSGGDWSVHRGGALFFEGVKDLSVVDCSFSWLGGNGVAVSNFARNTTINGSEFAWIGDSAIVLVGTTKFSTSHNKDNTDLMDGTDGNQPRGTTVTNNLIREVGYFGKQTSAIFQGVAGQTTIANNVMFNGPRAGINFNDGFLGGNLIRGNVMFNWVRETGDHGNFNSWDRLPYLTNATGATSTGIVENQITQNLMINNYASTWPIDHDDGSCFYNDTSNVLIYGGAKNFLGHSKVSQNNLYVEVDANGFKACALDDSLGANDLFINNKCTTNTGVMYYYSKCNPSNLNATVDVTYNNQFYTAQPLHFTCSKKQFTLKEYQQAGYDHGSTENPLPSLPTLLQWAEQLLDL